MATKNGVSNILQLDLFRKNKFHDDTSKTLNQKNVEYFQKYFESRTKSNVTELKPQKHDVST
jgi:hypothetical protein